MYKYKKIIFAGTFDHLHIGHEKMIDKAFYLAEDVALGIVSDKMAKNKILIESLQSYKIRRLSVYEYLKEKRYAKRAKIFTLDDIYGPAVSDSSMEAVLVTQATRKNALKVNTARKFKGLKQLKIVIAPYILAEDGRPISSERIRAGEIDREGKSYDLRFKDYELGEKEALVLPESLREQLRKPLGAVIRSGAADLDNKIMLNTAKRVLRLVNLRNWSMVMAVGDIIGMSLVKKGFKPDLLIVDGRSRRKPIPDCQFSNFNFQISNKCTNAAGTINIKTAKLIKWAIKNFLEKGQKRLIMVEGEEDLLALPSVLFAPLKSLVLYGQIDIGVVVVKVDEKEKKKASKLLGKFIY